MKFLLVSLHSIEETNDKNIKAIILSNPSLTMKFHLVALHSRKRVIKEQGYSTILSNPLTILSNQWVIVTVYSLREWIVPVLILVVVHQQRHDPLLFLPNLFPIVAFHWYV